MSITITLVLMVLMSDALHDRTFMKVCVEIKYEEHIS